MLFLIAKEVCADQGNIVLTDINPDTTITAGSTATVYGSSRANHVAIESGAKATLINFLGNNIITLQSDSSLFTVSRSGAMVKFEGSDGTVLEIPATKTSQTIVFSNCSSGLAINSGSVKLGEQVVSSASYGISSCSESFAEEFNPQIVFNEEKGVFILGDTISWHLEMENVPYQVQWSIDGQPIEQESFTPDEVGSYRLNGEITLLVTNEIINVARTILVDEMTPIASFQAGSEGGDLLVLDTDSGLDGARIEIPAGAVAANTEIVLSRATIDAMPYTGSEPLSPVLELQPSGTVFSKPVRIRIPFDPEQIEAGSDIQIARLSDGQLDYLTPLMVDTQAKEIVFETEHFSYFRLETGYLEKTPEEEFLQRVRNFMKDHPVWQQKNFTDEQLAVIINRHISSYSVNSYMLFDLFEKLKEISSVNTSNASVASDLTNAIRKLYPSASSLLEVASTMECLISGYSATIYSGGDNVMWKECSSKGDGIGKIVQVAEEFVPYTPSNPDWLEPIDGLMDSLKTAYYEYNTNSYPIMDSYYIPNPDICKVPKNANQSNLKQSFYSYIYMYWETVKEFKKHDLSTIEENLKNMILKAVAMDPSLVSIKNKFSSDSPLFSIDDDELKKRNARLNYFIVPNEIQSLSINVTPSSLNGTPIDYQIDDIIIDYEIGDDIKNKSPLILLKPGVHNIFWVQANIHYYEYDSDGNPVRKDVKSISKRYDVLRKGNTKRNISANSLNEETATRTKTNNIKNVLRAHFLNNNTTNNTNKTTNTRSAALELPEIPKASYAIDIKCGSYSYQVGSDGKLIVPASEAENAALSNCSARVYGTGAETDEDEIIESTFTIDLKSALKTANATELPTDRAVMGIYKINGTQVSKPRQEQDVTAGDTVGYIYYIPTGAAVLAYDLDANGAFRSSPDVTVTPVTVSGYTGFYTYSVTYSSGGTFQPLMKVRINGVESTASAPEVNVVPDGVSAITVAVSPQTTATEVNKSVSLTATITGDYDSIKWQKVQGPTSPASVSGSTTNKLSFTLPTAGSYTFAAKACNGSYCVSGEATVTAKAQTESAPDLVVTSIIVPTSGIIDGYVTHYVVVKNQGTVSSQACRLGYYLSLDSTITTDDINTYWGYNIPSLAAGQTYYYSSRPIAIPSTVTDGDYYLGAYVDSNNVVAESDESNNGLGRIISISSRTDTPKPAAPSNMSASGLSNSSIKLTWTDNSDNETGFFVYRENNGYWYNIAILEENITTYTDSNVSVNTIYNYVVLSYNSAGSTWLNGNDADYISATTEGVITKPNAPLNMWGTALSSSSIKLNWTDNSDNETGFYLYRWDGTSWIGIKTLGANITTYTDTNLSAATTYYYTIQSYNSAGSTWLIVNGVAGSISVTTKGIN